MYVQFTIPFFFSEMSRQAAGKLAKDLGKWDVAWRNQKFGVTSEWHGTTKQKTMVFFLSTFFYWKNSIKLMVFLMFCEQIALISPINLMLTNVINWIICFVINSYIIWIIFAPFDPTFASGSKPSRGHEAFRLLPGDGAREGV